jgi:hypothetical protein
MDNETFQFYARPSRCQAEEVFELLRGSILEAQFLERLRL